MSAAGKGTFVLLGFIYWAQIASAFLPPSVAVLVAGFPSIVAMIVWPILALVWWGEATPKPRSPLADLPPARPDPVRPGFMSSPPAPGWPRQP